MEGGWSKFGDGRVQVLKAAIPEAGPGAGARVVELADAFWSGGTSHGTLKSSRGSGKHPGFYGWVGSRGCVS